MRRGKTFFLSDVMLTMLLTGCGQKAENQSIASSVPAGKTQDTSEENDNSYADAIEEEAESASTLTVVFGYDGTPFTLRLEDNETAAAIAKHVGSADWDLPIYHFDDYEGWGNKIVTVRPGS